MHRFYDYGNGWERFYEISHKELAFVIDWLAQFGWDESKYDFGDEVHLADIDVENFTGCLFLFGYWSDEEPVIEFEHGSVVRWFRSGSWD